MASSRPKSTVPKKTKKAPSSPGWLKSIWTQRYGKLIVFVVVFAIIGLATLLITQAATTPAGRIVGRKSGKCLHNNGNRQVQGNPVSILGCQSGNLAQHWIMPDDLIIRSRGNYCLDTSNSSKSRGAKVVMNACSGSATQQWRAQSNGTLRHIASNLCLEVKDAKTADFSPVHINDCNTRHSALWSTPRGGTYTQPINGKLLLNPSSQSVRKGSNFTISVRINPGVPTDGVESTLTYDTTKLQYVSQTSTSSPYTSPLLASGGSGSVQTIRGILNAKVSADNSLVVTVTFKALTGGVTTPIGLTGNSTSNGVYNNPAPTGATVTLIN